ncbi:MAG TPA: hypothetical protein VL402_09315 [Xanthobacteraceae bacterium]|nr:hypothetical protein [Xanthobacteraceae bacterium]
MSVDKDAARRRREQSSDDIEKRTLAASGWSDEAHEPARADIQVDRRKRLEGSGMRLKFDGDTLGTQFQCRHFDLRPSQQRDAYFVAFSAWIVPTRVRHRATGRRLKSEQQKKLTDVKQDCRRRFCGSAIWISAEHPC